MATLGVKKRDRHHLFDGLLAIAMEGFEFDARDSLLVLALLYNSALEIGENPREMFDGAAKLASSEVAEALREFTRGRAPEDRTLKAMGYRLRTNPSAVLMYERTW